MNESLLGGDDSCSYHRCLMKEMPMTQCTLINDKSLLYLWYATISRLRETIWTNHFFVMTTLVHITNFLTLMKFLPWIFSDLIFHENLTMNKPIIVVKEKHYWTNHLYSNDDWWPHFDHLFCPWTYLFFVTFVSIILPVSLFMYTRTAHNNVTLLMWWTHIWWALQINQSVKSQSKPTINN